MSFLAHTDPSASQGDPRRCEPSERAPPINKWWHTPQENENGEDRADYGQLVGHRSGNCAYEQHVSHMKAAMAYGDAKAATPEPIAETIFKAATDGSNRLRYPVHGRLLRAVHAILPDAVWRSMLGAGMNRRAPVPPNLDAKAKRSIGVVD